MDRSPYFSGAILRSFDLGNNARDSMVGISRAVQAVLGITSTVVTELTASQNPSPNMNVLLTQGQIYSWKPVDATTFGTLAVDSRNILQQGYTDSQTLTLSTSALSGSQQQWALIQAGFQQVDEIRNGDPSGGVIPFFNVTNPPVPLQGPDGLGGSLPTVRRGYCDIDVLYGIPASPGNAIPPNASGGYVGLYLILLSANQINIENEDIMVAGPNVYAGYPPAPFLTGYLSAHHGGVTGQAPKIQLTQEVQGILPLANAPASNTVGILSCVRFGTGNPNGVLAGKQRDSYFDTAGGSQYWCTADGSNNWAQVGTGLPNILVASSPFDVANQTAQYLIDATSGDITINLPDINTLGPNCAIKIVKLDATDHKVIITSFTGQNIQKSLVKQLTLELRAAGSSAELVPCNSVANAAIDNTWYVS